MNLDRINKVIAYKSSNVSSVKKAEEITSAEIEKASFDNSNIKSVENENDRIVISKEGYGAERYLMCNPNMLYRYVNRSFITRNTFKVNKAAYAEAARKYGYRNLKKKSCFEESYI